MEPITVEPNYANLIRQFGNDAITYMDRIANSDDDVVAYEDVYSLVAATRIVLSAFHTRDSEVINAFIEFRDNFGEAAAKMFDTLNQLRAQKESDGDDN